MTPQEFREYAQAMKDFGLTRVKLGENVELIMGENFENSSVPNLSAHSPAAFSPNPSDQDFIRHKVQQATTLVSMNDMELAENLFPDPKPKENQ